jgi:hypothetical protein
VLAVSHHSRHLAVLAAHHNVFVLVKIASGFLQIADKE